MIAATLILAVASAPGGIVVPVDPGTSMIFVEACVQGQCDSDSSPLSGFWEIALDCLADPQAISLQDFDVQADEDLDFYIDYGFLGHITATGTGLALYHADPGPHQPFVPIVGGQYTFDDVFFLKRGVVSYEAAGIICGIIQGLGLPCVDTIDLSLDPPATLAPITGSIDIIGDPPQVVMSGHTEFSVPLVPSNPELGTISGVVDWTGSAPLPALGDLDSDYDVDRDDFAAYLDCVGGPGNPPAGTCLPGVSADLDCDGDVDFGDFSIQQINFTGP